MKLSLFDMNTIADTNIKNKNNCNENILTRKYQHMAEVVFIDTVEFTLPRRYVLVPGESMCRYREWSRGWVWTKMAEKGVVSAVQNVAPKGPGPVRVTIQTGQRRGWQDSRPITRASLYAALNDILPHIRILLKKRHSKKKRYTETVYDYAVPTLRNVITGMRVSRTDVALDMNPDVLAPSIGVGQAVSGHLRGRKRRISPIYGDDGRIETVYVGKREAKLCICVYDKQEQMREVKKEKIKPTTRFEIRTRKRISLAKLIALSKRCRRTSIRRKRSGRENSWWRVFKQKVCIISWYPLPVETPKNKGSPRKRFMRKKKTIPREMNVAGPAQWPAVGVFGDELSFLICFIFFICFT